MEEKLKEFEEYRVKVCKKVNIYLFIAIALIIIGFLLVFVGLPIFVILVIVGLIFIAISSNTKSKLSKEFKQKFVVNLVKEMYPDSIYDPNEGIDLESLLQPGFFVRPDRYFLEDYLKASYDDVEFEMCDFTFQEHHVTTDSKGNTRDTYVTYAQGRYMIFDFKREFNQILKVVENSYLGLNSRGLEKIETESIDFNKKFKTYTSDAVTAFYVLTPQIQLKLLELESKFKGSIYFAYMRGKLYVAIADGVSILDINASKKISLDTLKYLESQLNLPASIINELGLSDPKFATGEAI
jgi:hypothetical protein